MDEIKSIIDSIVMNIESNPEKLRFLHDLKLAKIHPKGVDAFFNEIRFDIHKKLNDNLIGHIWIDNDSPDPLKISDENGNTWIELSVNRWIQWDCIKHITEGGFLNELKDENSGIIEDIRKELWGKYKHQYKSEIKSFLQEYFYIEMINNYLTSLNTTSEQKGKKIINSASIELPEKTFRLKKGVDKILVVKYYNWLKNKKKSIKCTEIEFTSVFSNDKLPEGWEPLVWNDNKSALAAVILDLLIVPKSKPGIENMKQFFVDEKGNHVKPALQLSKNNLENYRPGKMDL